MSKKDEVFRLRLSAESKERLQAAADRAGMSLSEFVRECVESHVVYVLSGTVHDSWEEVMRLTKLRKEMADRLTAEDELKPKPDESAAVERLRADEKNVAVKMARLSHGKAAARKVKKSFREGRGNTGE